MNTATAETALPPTTIAGLRFWPLHLRGWGGRPASPVGYVAYTGGFLYVVMSYVGLYVAIKNQLALQIQNQLTLRAQAIAHEAQLKMLRYQLNPHFLFNTLNAISTLIVAQENLAAERMLGRLASFLRHSLDAEPTQRVTLQQELDALGLYLDIEKARFAERLHIVENIELQARSALVPSLLLQPLVENAIKYGVSKRVEGGTITIKAHCQEGRLYLQVYDDGPGFGTLRNGLPHGMGVGLSNARERLDVLYGKQSGFELENLQPQGAAVRMLLPFESDVVRARSDAGAAFDARLSAAMGSMR